MLHSRAGLSLAIDLSGWDEAVLQTVTKVYGLRLSGDRTVTPQENRIL
jgi:hypothetical protein